MNPHIHDPMFRWCTLFDPTLDFLDMSMIMVLHPTPEQLVIVVQMAFYMPLDMIDDQKWLAQDASILCSTR
jgi:hypothetical protein